MKIICTLALVCVTAGLWAQGKSDEFTRFVSELYVGLPGLDNVGLELNYVEHYSDNFLATQINSSTSTPHFGFKQEFLISPKLGMGFDFRYISSQLSGSYRKSDGNTYEVSMVKQRIGFLPSLFLHIADYERIDVNLQLGMGIKYKSIEETSNEPNFVPSIQDPETYKLSLRAGIGLRGYILPRFGMLMNVGFGHGGIFQFGTVYRF